MNDTGATLDTPNQIAHWVILSRLMGLAMEINTDGKLRPPGQKMSTLKMLQLEGVVPPEMRNTQLNRAIVLRVLLGVYLEIRPDWVPPLTICRAVI